MRKKRSRKDVYFLKCYNFISELSACVVLVYRMFGWLIIAIFYYTSLVLSKKIKLYTYSDSPYTVVTLTSITSSPITTISNWMGGGGGDPTPK